MTGTILSTSHMVGEHYADITFDKEWDLHNHNINLTKLELINIEINFDKFLKRLDK